jgi:undecaprenyl-diphosphatase
VAAGLSAGLALAIGKVISELVDRARPFVAHPSSVHLFTRHAADAGFPSDHATASFAIAVAILLRKRAWGTVVLVAAIVLCIGRVAIGVHYPSDVLGGALLGSLAALLLWWSPIRSRLNGLSDVAGGIWDGALDWFLTHARLALRS